MIHRPNATIPEPRIQPKAVFLRSFMMSPDRWWIDGEFARRSNRARRCAQGHRWQVGLRCKQSDLRSALGTDSRPHDAKLSRSRPRSEEHTSELQSLMRISYAVF